MNHSRYKSVILFFFFPTIFLFAKDQKIVEKLDQVVEAYCLENNVTGISVVTIGRDNLQKFQKIINKGTISRKSSIPINNLTEFRLGPISQIFTATILAYFVNEGRINLNDPISKFLPKSSQTPTYNGIEITIGDLATHTSGLPDMPQSLSSRSSFTVSQMYRFLSKYEMSREPGTEYEYSNIGYAFLTNLLSRIAKRAYPEIVLQTIFYPLNLKDTSFYLSHEQKTRLSTGYEKGQGISPLLSEKLYSVFIGSSGLYSTPHDMLYLLSYHLGKEQTSLNSILSIIQHPYHSFERFQVGLGWKIIPYDNEKLFYIEGNLFGFTTYMGIIPEKDVGIVILMNQADKSIDLLGKKLLNIMTP